MSWSMRIALRYLFARKSRNIINIITGIAVLGLAVGAAALILVLSVFNGFEDLFTKMYSNFDPDIKITPKTGKTFAVDSLFIQKLQEIDGVAFVSETIEEVAFFEMGENQEFGVLKGVDDYYDEVTRIDSVLVEGKGFKLREGASELAVLGIGMVIKLELAVASPQNLLVDPLAVYMPKRKTTSFFEKQFRKRFVYPAASFSVQQEYDSRYVITSLDFARSLIGYDKEVSALELRLESGYSEGKVVRAIKDYLGDDFEVKNRYEQQESFLKLMRVEKLLAFAIVNLMMILVAFNIIGALWMIVLEKKKDIAILKSMGAMDSSIRNIFLNEGLLLSLLGLGIGFVLAILLFVGQKTFGFIKMPGSFVVSSYPISLRAIDFLVVAVSVIGITLLASILPALRAQRISGIIREE